MANFKISANFNLVLVILVLFVFLADFKKSLAVSLWSGLIFDLYSPLPFGIFLFSFAASFIILEFLLQNFFTNRSFYSLIFLGLFGAAVYHLIFLIASGLIYLIGGSEFLPTASYWYLFLGQIVTTVFLLAICYSLIDKISKRFKPMFLGR
ncbi:MAG: hypothetical protein AAB358_00600 [Patescibacteria group bacterium]